MTGVAEEDSGTGSVKTGAMTANAPLGSTQGTRTVAPTEVLLVKRALRAPGATP